MRSTAVCVAVALLGACSLAPPHSRPELPTPASYPESFAGDTESGVRAATLGWSDFFADPRLGELVRIALARNRDLLIAVTQVEEARGLYGIQRADRLPTLSISADALRTGLGPEAAVTTGRTGVTPAPTPTPGSERVTFDRYTLGVGFTSFELDFWGRVRNLSEAARSEYLATVEAARAFQLTLIREVALAYLASLEAAERLALAEATVETRREGLRIARRRLEAGVTSALDFRQAETLLTQAETELAALRLAKAQNDNFLAVLLGGPNDQPLPQGLPLSEQMTATTLAAGIPSELLITRPDIQAAEERLRASRANVGAARAAFFPSITLTGTHGYASSELDELVGEEARTWTFGPTIVLPIFDFGRRRGNLTVAEARENIAVADYEQTILESFQEVADALAGREYLAQQVDAQTRATVAQRQLAELARKRYSEGVISYIEVLDAERNLFAAEQALLQVKRGQVANFVTLYVALGGGSIER